MRLKKLISFSPSSSLSPDADNHVIWLSTLPFVSPEGPCVCPKRVLSSRDQVWDHSKDFSHFPLSRQFYPTKGSGTWKYQSHWIFLFSFSRTAAKPSLYLWAFILRPVLSLKAAGQLHCGSGILENCWLCSSHLLVHFHLQAGWDFSVASHNTWMQTSNPVAD